MIQEGSVVEPPAAGFVTIPGGTFTMGSPATEGSRNDNEMQHQVTVSAFRMGKYPVTQKEWEDVMGSLPDVSDRSGKGDNYPVYDVNWCDAVEYCNKLSEKEGREKVYTIVLRGLEELVGRPLGYATVTADWGKNGYRLPTEAEWEYACRAGTTTAYNWGSDTIDSTKANYNPVKTTPVGNYAANAWGLYDMHGNVGEWCWDWYRVYDSWGQTDPKGAVSGSFRVLRGGARNIGGQSLRSARRGYDSPDSGYSSHGFRLVCPEPCGGAPQNTPPPARDVLNVTGGKSTDATLKSLYVSAETLEPEFSAAVTEYRVAAVGDGDTVSVNAEANHGKAAVNKSGKALDSSGTTEIKITVTAEDGTTRKTYTITVTRVVTPAAAGFVTIPGGTFMMGSPATERIQDDDKPQHQVTLSAFRMGKYPVTQAEWKAVMGSENNPSRRKGDTLPVECVSWYDAVEYCNKLSEKEGREKVYTINGTAVTADWSKNGYRLPTEAEWEYACRAGTTTRWNWGSDTIDSPKANFHSLTGMKPVGSYAANAWGLYDMHGNVWEWCWDWYGDYGSAALTNPTGPSSGSGRVLRGESWHTHRRYVSSAGRGHDSPDCREKFDSTGFRLACSVF